MPNVLILRRPTVHPQVDIELPDDDEDDREERAFL